MLENEKRTIGLLTVTKKISKKQQGSKKQGKLDWSGGFQIFKKSLTLGTGK